MGYYSEVVVAVRKDAVESFESACAELVALADDRTVFQYDRTEGVAYSWHSIKWEEDHPEVTAYYRWESAIASDQYAMVRIGADWDDMERGGYLDCGLCIERSISVGW